VILASLRVENYRSFADETIVFDDYTCLVGPNGAGKSSALNALNVLFRNSDASVDVQHMDKEDFHCQNTNKPIRITAVFRDLSRDAKEELKAYVRQDQLVVAAIADWDAETQLAAVRQVGYRMVIKRFAPFFEAFDDRNTRVAGLRDIYSDLASEFSDLPSESTRDGMRQALRSYEESHSELCELMESTDQFYGWTRGVNRLAHHL